MEQQRRTLACNEQANSQEKRGMKRSVCMQPPPHTKLSTMVHWGGGMERGGRERSTTGVLPLMVWITINCGKFFKRREYQNTLPASWETCMQVKKQQLEPDMEQQTGSKLGTEYFQAVYCHPTYLTYVQSTSWEMLGWMKPKLESRLPGEISITSDTQMTPPLWQKVKGN